MLRKLGAIVILLAVLNFIFFLPPTDEPRKAQRRKITKQIRIKKSPKPTPSSSLTPSQSPSKINSVLINPKAACHDCIHIITAASVEFNEPLLAFIYSLQLSTTTPFQVHVITVRQNSSYMIQKIKSVKAFTVPIEIFLFDKDEIQEKIAAKGKKRVSTYTNALNYVRFYLPDLFPDLDQIIYMDPDIVVLSDINSMIREFQNRKDKTLFFGAVVGQGGFTGTYGHLVDVTNPKVASRVTEPNLSYFNAGVYITSLEKWRTHNITAEIEGWLEEHAENNIWSLGSQPPLCLAFYKRWYRLSDKWNKRKLYNKLKKDSSSTPPKDGAIHFAGTAKPWRMGRMARIVWNLWCRFYPDKNSRFFKRRREPNFAPCTDDGGINLPTTTTTMIEDGEGDKEE